MAKRVLIWMSCQFGGVFAIPVKGRTWLTWTSFHKLNNNRLLSDQRNETWLWQLLQHLHFFYFGHFFNLFVWGLFSQHIHFNLLPTKMPPKPKPGSNLPPQPQRPAGCREHPRHIVALHALTVSPPPPLVFKEELLRSLRSEMDAIFKTELHEYS